MADFPYLNVSMSDGSVVRLLTSHGNILQIILNTPDGVFELFVTHRWGGTPSVHYLNRLGSGGLLLLRVLANVGLVHTSRQ